MAELSLPDVVQSLAGRLFVHLADIDGDTVSYFAGRQSISTTTDRSGDSPFRHHRSLSQYPMLETAVLPLHADDKATGTPSVPNGRKKGR
jgi:hypothetical protein